MGTAFSRAPGDLPDDFDPTAGGAPDRPSLSPRATGAAVGNGRPYPPSWVDRLTDWVRRLPLPAGVFYLALGLGLALTYLAVVLSPVPWRIVPLSPTVLVFYSLLNGLTYAYLLGLIHYLDHVAATALARFRPVLTVDDAGYHRLVYHLTTLPARPTWIAACLGGAYTFVALWLNAMTTDAQAPRVMSPAGIGLAIVSNLGIYVLVGVAVYHTLHQLRMVNTIYTQYARIDLFEPGPLYALSGLTARTAVAIGIPTYIWFQANTLSILGTTASDIIQTVFLGVIMVVTFLWPLVGAHQRLEREKQQLHDEAGRRIKATIATLHRRADTGDLTEFAALKAVLDGLVTEQGMIDKLRTWPWRTETVAGFGVAFFVPMIIWFVQRVLERLGV